MNERPAKIAVIFHMLFTVVSLFLAIYFFLFVKKGLIPTVGLPIWMAYAVYSSIKSIADIIGQQRRYANFTRMLNRWQDTFGNRPGALLLLTFMTVIVGAVKLAVPMLLMQL